MQDAFLSNHTPVMLREVLALLSPHDGANYLDCTFGGGGYSRAILNSCNCNVVALDRDPHVKLLADKVANEYKGRFHFIETNFAESFDKLPYKKFNGIVMDLGVSSMQLDEGARGFSFTYDGPLDMRMSGTGMSAEDFINEASEQLLADIIYKYGDEKHSRKIARKIIEARGLEKITTTAKLADIVRGAVGFKKGKIDTATKTFQAIRIYINDELGQLERFLAKVKDILADHGRLLVVSFHSLEDRIVKEFFRTYSVKHVARSKYAKHPLDISSEGKYLKILTKKPALPSREEVQINPRSRSARLRATEVQTNIGR